MKIEQLLDIIDRPTAWAWIRRQYLPAGIICPVCGAIITGTKPLASFKALERTYCRAHGSSFRPMATIAPLRGTEWEPEEFVKLLLLHFSAVPVPHIGKLLGKSPGCVRDMLDRLAVLGQLSITGGGSVDG
jgi:hypothetical protein